MFVCGQQVLELMGLSTSPKEAEELFNTVDTNHDGRWELY